jgi:predicted nucleic acid-binding Zn ribbon protein
MIKYFVTVFLADMLIRVFVNPKYAPTLIIGRLIVKRQVPEYVGAKQKKFAWYIGLFLASTMFVLMVLMNTYSAISGLSCFICLIFLFFESAFGICLGCIVYKWIYKEKAQYCPGEVCEIKDRQEIQKTSLVQWMIVLGLVVFVVLLAYTFNDHMSLKPVELFTGEGLPQ